MKVTEEANTKIELQDQKFAPGAATDAISEEAMAADSMELLSKVEAGTVTAKDIDWKENEVLVPKSVREAFGAVTYGGTEELLKAGNKSRWSDQYRADIESEQRQLNAKHRCLLILAELDVDEAVEVVRELYENIC